MDRRFRQLQQQFFQNPHDAQTALLYVAALTRMGNPIEISQLQIFSKDINDLLAKAEILIFGKPIEEITTCIFNEAILAHSPDAEMHIHGVRFNPTTRLIYVEYQMFTSPVTRFKLTYRTRGMPYRDQVITTSHSQEQDVAWEEVVGAQTGEDPLDVHIRSIDTVVMPGYGLSHNQAVFFFTKENWLGPDRWSYIPNYTWDNKEINSSYLIANYGRALEYTLGYCSKYLDAYDQFIAGARFILDYNDTLYLPRLVPLEVIDIPTLETVGRLSDSEKTYYLEHLEDYKAAFLEPPEVGAIYLIWQHHSDKEFAFTIYQDHYFDLDRALGIAHLALLHALQHNGIKTIYAWVPLEFDQTRPVV